MEEPSRMEELKSDVLCSKTSRERELVKSSGVCVCVRVCVSCANVDAHLRSWKRTCLMHLDDIPIELGS